MKVEMKLTGLDGVLDTLKSLPPEVVSRRGGPVLAALKKGAKVIWKAEQANLARVVNNATASGKKESTGLVQKNLVITRGKAPFGGNGERVLIRVKRKTYPDRKGGKPVTTIKTASLLETGSSQQVAEPWARPAFNAKAAEAIKTTETELLKGIDRIVKKLARQNKGR